VRFVVDESSRPICGTRRLLLVFVELYHARIVGSEQNDRHRAHRLPGSRTGDAIISRNKALNA